MSAGKEGLRRMSYRSAGNEKRTTDEMHFCASFDTPYLWLIRNGLKAEQTEFTLLNPASDSESGLTVSLRLFHHFVKEKPAALVAKLR
jgi:hypothetical protein